MRLFQKKGKNMKRGVLVVVVAGLVPGLAMAINVKRTFKKAASGVAQVAKAATAPVVAPATAIAQMPAVVTGKESLEQAGSKSASVLTSAPKGAGQGVGKLADVAADVQNAPLNLVSQGAGAVGGHTGALVGDALTLPTRIQNEIDYTSVNALADTLQGQNPLQVNPYSGALALALQTAYDQHKGNAKSIPEEIKRMLAPYYPADVLARAKYVVGDPKVALPDGLVAFNDDVLGKSGYAVTIDDIIVFSSLPTAEAGIGHWAHELQHVAQYARLGGIRAFAYQYMTRWSNGRPALETEAYASEAYINSLRAIHLL